MVPNAVVTEAAELVGNEGGVHLNLAVLEFELNIKFQVTKCPMYKRCEIPCLPEIAMKAWDDPPWHREKPARSSLS